MQSVRRTILLFAVAAGCATAPNETVPQVRFDRDVPSALRVERAPTGHLLVWPRINGREAGAFIFDTGAGICVVSTPYVERLGLTPCGELDAVGIGGSTVAKTWVAATVELGPWHSTEHTFLATDLSFLAEHLGQPIAGVLGYGMLSRCVAELDFETPRIALFDPDRYALAVDANWMPLDLDGRTPAIRARFEGHEGLFQIDTGANTAVSFHEPAVRRWSLLDGRDVADGRLGGVGGTVAAKTGRLASFEFGGVRQEQVAASFTIEAKGAHAGATRDGAIGTPLLRPFVMVTDYPHARVAFRPRDAAAVGG